MVTPPTPLYDWEPQLQDLYQDTLQLLADVFALHDGSIRADDAAHRTVSNQYLTKIENDFQCIKNLAEAGFSIQMATLASSLFESCYQLINVVNDEKAAEVWQEWDDQRKVPEGSVFNVVDRALKKLQTTIGLEAGTKTEDLYRLYYQLMCVSKHGNPMVIKRFGYEVSEHGVFLKRGPETHPMAFKLALYAGYGAIRSVVHALFLYLRTYHPQGQAEPFMPRLVDLSNKNFRVFKERGQEMAEGENGGPLTAG